MKLDTHVVSRPLWVAASALAVLCMCAACGGGTPTPGESAQTYDAADDADDTDAFGICRMLTADQVAGVLPGHDGGTVAHSGGSLIEGVDSYQCSYSSQQAGGFGLFTLIVSVASTDALFEDIKPSGFAHDGDETLAVADGGWISDHQEDDLKVTVLKGRTVADLELLAPNAGSMKARMVELTKVVAGKL